MEDSRQKFFVGFVSITFLKELRYLFFFGHEYSDSNTADAVRVSKTQKTLARWPLIF